MCRVRSVTLFNTNFTQFPQPRKSPVPVSFRGQVPLAKYRCVWRSGINDLGNLEVEIHSIRDELF